MSEFRGTLESYYAARAAEYDDVYRKPERQPDLRAIERWLPGRFAGLRVLEVACGTGYWTQWIAPVAAHVLAVDAAPETMAIAMKRVPPDKVTFVRGDAYALPAEASGLEAAFAGFWLSHVPRSRVRGFLRGLHRHLASGARVVLLDNRFVPGSSTPIARRDAEDNTYQERRLRDGATHLVLKNFPTEGELLAELDGIATGISYRRWGYFWAVEYAAVPDPAAPLIES